MLDVLRPAGVTRTAEVLRVAAHWARFSRGLACAVSPDSAVTAVVRETSFLKLKSILVVESSKRGPRI